MCKCSHNWVPRVPVSSLLWVPASSQGTSIPSRDQHPSGYQHPSQAPESLKGTTIILGDQCPSGGPASLRGTNIILGNQHWLWVPASSQGASIPSRDQHPLREPTSSWKHQHHPGGTSINLGDQNPSPPAVQAPRHLSKPLNSHYFKLSLGKHSLGSQAESSMGSCAARC